MAIFALSMGGAFLCACVYVIMLQMSLPPTDWAYGQGLFSGFSGFLIHKRRLVPCAAFCLAAVLLEIVVVTPLDHWMGFNGCFLALLLALLICRFSGYRAFEVPK